MNTPLLAILGVPKDKWLQEKSLKYIFAHNFDFEKVEDLLVDIAQSYFQIAESDKTVGVYSSQLSRPIQKKVLQLLCAQMAIDEGRASAFRIIRCVLSPINEISSEL